MKRSALKGSAAQVIAAIPTSDAQYPQAWEALTKRFDNKRIQATNYLMKVFNFKPLPKQSLENLELFSNVVLESATAFRSLQLEDPSGFILLTFGLTRLDSKTRERFEDKYSSSTVVPTFQHFHDFIQEQSMQLQTNSFISAHNTGTAITNQFRHPKGTKQILMTTDVSSQNKTECFECRGKHRIYDCPRFRSFDYQQRFDKIKSLRKCINCLCSGHLLTQCPSQNSCRHCGRKHRYCIFRHQSIMFLCKRTF